MAEIWKDIAGYEGKYQVSSLGNVKSLSRVLYNKDGIRHKRIVSDFNLKFLKEGKGYYQVSLYNNGKPIRHKVHRLVANAFILNKDLNKNLINHINGIKTDNRVENLEWVTYRENSTHYLLNNAKSNLPIGVKKHKNRYVSRITFNKKEIHLGSFKSIELAQNARIKFEQENLLSNKYLQQLNK
jgi:hypothetical protein